MEPKLHPKLPVYFINLDSRPERRAFMEAQLLERGVSATRISAVTAEVAAQRLPKGWSRASSEFGCTMSHMIAWRMLLEGNAPAAVILEDDAVLARDFGDALEAVRSLGPRTADLVKPETLRRRVVLGGERQRASTRYEIRRLLSFHPGSAGYIISRQAAQKSLRALPDYLLPHDRYLFGSDGAFLFSGTIYQVTPGACIQAEYTNDPGLAVLSKSDLEAGRLSSAVPTGRQLAQGYETARRRISQFAAALSDPAAFLPRRMVPFADD